MTDKKTDDTPAAKGDGVWRAVGLLQVHGTPAFGPGQPVPTSHPMFSQWREDGSVEQGE